MTRSSKVLFRILSATCLMIMALIAACGSDDGPVSIAPFEIVDDTTIRLNGVINSNTENAFDEVLLQNPNTTLLVFGEAPGSEDDETNLRVGKKLFQKGLNTAVEANGFIASGAVDLFLAGAQRSLGANTRVGVHSWSDGTNEATDFPTSSSEHQLFIEYYKAIGLEDQLAESFYFFTINAAPAADIHWMTEEEIATYQITTN